MIPKVFFTSDTHFGHANIIKYCARPYSSVEEMNRDLIERWNSVVGPLDTIYHLGDFSLGKVDPSDILRKLNGKRKILIRGNHDRSLERMMAYGFTEAYNQLDYEGWRLQHKPYKTSKKLLCGHIHEKWRRLGWTVNVGVDVWGYTPRTLAEIEACPQDKESTYKCDCGAIVNKIDDNSEHYDCRRQK